MNKHAYIMVVNGAKTFVDKNKKKLKNKFMTSIFVITCHEKVQSMIQ